MSETLNQNLEQFFNLDWGLYKSKLDKVNLHKEQVAYNIVSVSTYSGHLENYHSGIWGFLLDPTAAHQKGNLFLTLFVDYLCLNKIFPASYKEDLCKATVYREKGRIDVLIVNEESKNCIIVENKINNAVDQQNQLGRYKNYAEKKGWKILAILYVTATGGSLTTVENSIVHPIAASNNTQGDILNGWILPSKLSIPLSNEPSDENIRSFLHQYSMLLQHLTSETLSNMSTELLYQFLNDKNNFETALLIEKHLENIKLERLKIFNIAMEKIDKEYFNPAFKKRTHYTGCLNHMIFESFNHSGLKFQLDIEHFKNRTKFTFYNPDRKVGANQTIEILKSIIGEHEFKGNAEANSHHITFQISLEGEIDSLTKLDEGVRDYAINLFDKMNIYTKNANLKN